MEGRQKAGIRVLWAVLEVGRARRTVSGPVSRLSLALNFLKSFNARRGARPGARSTVLRLRAR